MECPECRQKYTTRTLKKIFLNVVPKDDDETTPQYLELQREKLLSANLQRDNKIAQTEREQMAHELMKSRYEFQNLV
jgi:transcriptional regulator NrdR family protein